MSVDNVPAIFLPGTRVEVVQFGRVVDTATVVRDNRSEIILRPEGLKKGRQIRLAYSAHLERWRTIHPDLDDNDCVSQRDPGVVIRLAAPKKQGGAKTSRKKLRHAKANKKR